jgi:hypothetical protein
VTRRGATFRGATFRGATFRGATFRALVIVCALGAVAHAETEPVVVVNATPELGSDEAGQIERLRRALEARGLLVALPTKVEAALDGGAALVVDLDAVKDRWAAFDYDGALALIDEQEARILEGGIAGDPALALAALAQWRGLIASAQGDDDGAITWFRAAATLDPALTLDKRYASPSVRQLAKRARRPVSDRGTLSLDVDVEDARVAIDGGERQAIEDLQLAAGVHLVQVTAAGRAPFADLVEITADGTERLQITLRPETPAHKAARLVDDAAAAPSGKARLDRATAIAEVTGATRILVVEDGADDHVTVRIYDVGARRVSRPLELSDRASSAKIASLVTAALDGDDGLVPIDTSPAWYRRWYVWAGAAAVVAGSLAVYQTTRDPTSIKGF